jgi:hypothetical protein
MTDKEEQTQKGSNFFTEECVSAPTLPCKFYAMVIVPVESKR